MKSKPPRQFWFCAVCKCNVNIPRNTSKELFAIQHLQSKNHLRLLKQQWIAKKQREMDEQMASQFPNTSVYLERMVTPPVKTKERLDQKWACALCDKTMESESKDANLGGSMHQGLADREFARFLLTIPIPSLHDPSAQGDKATSEKRDSSKCFVLQSRKTKARVKPGRKSHQHEEISTKLHTPLANIDLAKRHSITFGFTAGSLNVSITIPKLILGSYLSFLRAAGFQRSLSYNYRQRLRPSKPREPNGKLVLRPLPPQPLCNCPLCESPHSDFRQMNETMLLRSTTRNNQGRERIGKRSQKKPFGWKGNLRCNVYSDWNTVILRNPKMQPTKPRKRKSAPKQNPKQNPNRKQKQKKAPRKQKTKPALGEWTRV